MDSLLLSAVLLLSVLGTSRLAAAGFIAAGGGRVGLGRVVLRADDDLGAVAELVGAVDHNALAGCEAGKDFDALAFGYAELDRPNRYRRVVIDDVDEGAGRPALDACGRDRRDVGVGIEQQANVDELVRVEQPVVVGKYGAQLDRPGGRIDLAVEA